MHQDDDWNSYNCEKTLFQYLKEITCLPLHLLSCQMNLNYEQITSINKLKDYIYYIIEKVFVPCGNKCSTRYMKINGEIQFEDDEKDEEYSNLDLEVNNNNESYHNEPNGIEE